jgi:nitroimidazol reductase NimA-like FMN-containing flavoprotein (pyridoxamine 5'-phosphate oxidase superfamily)
MPRDYLKQPLNQMRRSDRAQDDDWIRALLKRGGFGVMATSYEDQPFTNTRQYVYDESGNAVYMHGARTGRTPAVIAANNRVCFSVSEMGRLIPADEAVEVSVEYASVMLFGKVSVIDDPEEATHALQMLMDKYFPHLKPIEDYRPIEPQDLKITAVLRIDIESWSGKRKQVEGDPPGSFYFRDIKPFSG